MASSVARSLTYFGISSHISWLTALRFSGWLKTIQPIGPSFSISSLSVSLMSGSLLVGPPRGGPLRCISSQRPAQVVVWYGCRQFQQRNQAQYRGAPRLRRGAPSDWGSGGLGAMSGPPVKRRNGHGTG